MHVICFLTGLGMICAITAAVIALTIPVVALTIAVGWLGVTVQNKTKDWFWAQSERKQRRLEKIQRGINYVLLSLLAIVAAVFLFWFFELVGCAVWGHS